jgi:hypothetical protein
MFIATFCVFFHTLFCIYFVPVSRTFDEVVRRQEGWWMPISLSQVLRQFQPALRIGDKLVYGGGVYIGAA